MAKKIIMVSESGDLSTTPIGAFIACLVVFILDTNLEPGDKDTQQFKTSFQTWARLAQPFVLKFKLKKEFEKMSKIFLSGKGPGLDEEGITEIGKTLVLDKRAAFVKDTSISKEVLDLLLTCGRYLRKDNDSSWNKLQKNVSLLRDPKLTAIFLDDKAPPPKEGQVDALKASKQMRVVYKKITGKDLRTGYTLLPDVMGALKEKNPKLLAEYGMLSKSINAEVKHQVFKLVRTSGKTMIPVDTAVRRLNDMGIVHNLPVGFVGGQIDENGVFFTKEGRQLDKKPTGKVTMNPKYDPATDATYVLNSDVWGPKKGAGRARTLTMGVANKVKRHKAANSFLDKEDSYRAKWLKDLNRKGSKEQVMAAMVEMLWATSARIGGKDNKSKGETTYGLSTLEVSHVKVVPGKIKFNYIGKKNAPQPATYPTNSVEGKKVAEIVEKCLKDKTKDEMVFTWRDKPILRSGVNLYLKALNIPIGAHGFRRVSGTKAAMAILQNNPFKKMMKAGKAIKEVDVNKWFKSELTKVGEVLHHRTGEKVTAMTAVKSYISPEVLINFYEELGLRVPKFIPKVKD